MQRMEAPEAGRSARASLATVDVDVSALHALDARLSDSRDRPPFGRHAYLALACIKALDTDGDAPVRLGIRAGGYLATLDGTARDTLSAIAARMAHVQPGGTGGDVAIFAVDGRTRLLAPAIPHGWRMALGVGGVRAVRGKDATHEMTLALAYDAASIDHAFAAELLDRITALLE
jgi:hypothetical protein